MAQQQQQPRRSRCGCGLLMLMRRRQRRRRRLIAGQCQRLLLFALLLRLELSTATPTATAAAFIVPSRVFSGAAATSAMISRDPNSNRRCSCDNEPLLLLLSLPVISQQRPHQQTRLCLYGRRIDRWRGERNGGTLFFEASESAAPQHPATARGSTALNLAPPEPQQPVAPNGADASDTPAPYDGSALARDVFANAYFYGGNIREAKGREGLRHEKLRDMTVREAFQAAYGKYGLDALKRLAADTEAYVYCVSDYVNGADIATKQELASKALGAAFSCSFNVAELPICTIHESLLPLLRDSQADDSLESRTIDMSFLDPLRDAEEEKFLVPDKIYVRDCMRRVFSLFHEDAVQVPRRRPSKAYSAALIGSPGVGKSILFFLAALDQACTSNVVYYRRVGAEAASVFVMTPDGDGSRVRIWFARNVRWRSNVFRFPLLGVL
jgi:hypothetical protein